MTRYMPTPAQIKRMAAKIRRENEKKMGEREGKDRSNHSRPPKVYHVSTS